MKFFRDLFKNTITNNDLMPQRFSFTVAFFGILVPIYRRDFRWFSIYSLIILFLLLLGFLGFSSDLLILLLLLWNSILACYYNTWTQKKEFWMDDRYQKRSDTDRKRREESSSAFLLAIKKRFNMALKKFVDFRKIPPARRDFHLRNIIIVFSLTIFYYLLSAMFLDEGLKTLTTPSLTREYSSKDYAREVSHYYTFLSKEIHHLQKLERKRGDLLSDANNKYPSSSYNKDLTFIEKRLNHQKSQSAPAGFEDFHRDLEVIYTTYEKFLTHQHLYLSSGSKKDKTMAVNYRHRFFLLEDKFLSSLEKKFQMD